MAMNPMLMQMLMAQNGLPAASGLQSAMPAGAMGFGGAPQPGGPGGPPIGPQIQQPQQPQMGGQMIPPMQGPQPPPQQPGLMQQFTGNGTGTGGGGMTPGLMQLFLQLQKARQGQQGAQGFPGGWSANDYGNMGAGTTGQLNTMYGGNSMPNWFNGLFGTGQGYGGGGIS